MSDNTIVRRGYLTLHRNPGGRFQLATLSSKRMWMVLCRESVTSTGRPRIEMYRTEDSVREHQPQRVVDLETVRSVKPVERKKGFMVELLDETMLFQCTSKADMEDWIRDMNRLRGGVDLASGQNLTELTSGHDIYEVVPDDETFRVKLRKSNSLRFSGQCLLEILRDFDRNLFHIALFTEDEPPRLIVKWQIDHIRQYGSNQMAFKFQSGSKSSTGVDWFIVDTEHGAAVRVHKGVDYWAKHIVEQIKNTHVISTTRVRAPSVPTPGPPAPGRPPRMSVGPTLSTNKDTRPNDQTYAELKPTNREQAGVYQAVVGKRTEHKDNSTGGGKPDPSSGVYQPLGRGDNPSTYETVSSRSGKGDRTAKGGSAKRSQPTSPTGANATYMGLRPDTRQPSNDGTYMVPDRK